MRVCVYVYIYIYIHIHTNYYMIPYYIVLHHTILYRAWLVEPPVRLRAPSAVDEGTETPQ